jgi:hypothetical protein
MTCDACGVEESTVPLAYRVGWRVRRTAARTLNRFTRHLL